MGIFTLSQSNLLEPYQRSETEPEAETHIYSSVNFGTNHRLRQLHLLEGLPTSETGHYQWTLKGLVTGCLVMVQRQAESEARIQRVIVSSTTHTAPMP